MAAHRLFTRRAFRAWMLAAIAGLCSTPALAKKHKGACTVAYETARQQEKDGNLVGAQDSLATCSKTSCGWTLSHKCTKLADRLRANVPTIIVLAKDTQGVPRTDVQVKVDGTLLASELDGRALPINPGVHELAFSTASGIALKTKVMIAEGDHYRHITVDDLPPRSQSAPAAAAAAAPEPEPASATPAESTPAPSASVSVHEGEPQSAPSEAPPMRDEPSSVKRHRTLWPYVLGGVGIAGLASSGVLVLWGNKDNNKLASCSPRCPQASVDHVKNLYLAADISFGVGAAALATAAILFATSSPKAEKPPERTAYTFSVQPTPSGAYGSVQGSF